MIGFERNADVVKQSAFGALLRHANGTEWDYTLVAYDSHRWFGLPSYYVQRLFARNRPDSTLRAERTGGVVAGLVASSRGGSVVVKATLSGAPTARNSLGDPTHVAPRASSVAKGADGSYTVPVPPWALVVVTIPIGGADGRPPPDGGVAAAHVCVGHHDDDGTPRASHRGGAAARRRQCARRGGGCGAGGTKLSTGSAQRCREAVVGG
eukprot:gene14921-23461_t